MKKGGADYGKRHGMAQAAAANELGPGVDALVIDDGVAGDFAVVDERLRSSGVSVRDGGKKHV